MTNLATFALGCFWGAEEAFRVAPGVVATTVGQMDRAEVVQVLYDPAQTTYENLLMIFWDNHDPTISNPGGLERSEIFFHNAEQKKAAANSKGALAAAGKYRKPIVTPISPASEFIRAPEDQQQYYLKRGIESCKT